MVILVILVHWIFAIILFVLINLIGRKSLSFGYSQITLSQRTEEAPAFNFLLRVLGPVFYLFILSAILYKLKLDFLVTNIYFVCIYYVSFRLLFNSILERQLLVNWYKQLFYWFSLIGLSIIAYDTIIKTKNNLIPDSSMLSSELWLVIIIYIYHIINKLSFDSNVVNKNRDRYIHYQYILIKNKYGHIVKSVLNKVELEILAYAIIIFENFNRPKFARIIENGLQKFLKREFTLGIMQYKSNKFINDYQSIELGCKKIQEVYSKIMLKNEDMNYYDDWMALNHIIESYNVGSLYLSEVRSLYDFILEHYYQESESYLRPSLFKYKSLDKISEIE